MKESEPMISRPAEVIRFVSAHSLRWLFAILLLAAVVTLFLYFDLNFGVAASLNFNAPEQSSPDGVWRSPNQASPESQRNRGLRAFRPVALNISALAAILNNAPTEFATDAKERRTVLNLPSPDGTFARF